MNELFCLYWYDETQQSHCEKYLKPLDECKPAFDRLTTGPAARMGFVTRIKVTDSLDCLVLDLSRHEGRWVDTQHLPTQP